MTHDMTRRSAVGGLLASIIGPAAVSRSTALTKQPSPAPVEGSAIHTFRAGDMLRVEPFNENFAALVNACLLLHARVEELERRLT